MNTLITSPLELTRAPALDDLVQAIRDEHRHAESTWQTWEKCFQDFARFSGVTSHAEAAALLMGSGAGVANRTARAYRADMIQRDLATATINLRLWALRKAVDMARTLGLVDWTLDAPGLELRPSRDVEGPGIEWVQAALRLLATDISEGSPARGGTAQAVRDRAIVRLLFDLGLRRGSVASLDVDHLDLSGRRLAVRFKGQRDREPLALPEPTAQAIAQWLDVRQRALACRPHCRQRDTRALFVALDRAHCGNRLTGRSLHRIISGLATRIGQQPVWPHAIRHTAISYVADQTGDAYVTNAFARHASMSTTLRYIDRKQDRAFQGATLAAGVE